jgi:hypothetical protein
MKCKVGVEKRLYATGTVEVEADDPDAAVEKVQDMIAANALRTQDVEWQDTVFEDMSFWTTGDVD